MPSVISYSNTRTTVPALTPSHSPSSPPPVQVLWWFTLAPSVSNPLPHLPQLNLALSLHPFLVQSQNPIVLTYLTTPLVHTDLIHLPHHAPLNRLLSLPPLKPIPPQHIPPLQ